MVSLRSTILRDLRLSDRFSPFSISARLGSRNGGSASFSPSVSIGSSVAKPGPSVAISNRMPFGSRKYRLRNRSGRPRRCWECRARSAAAPRHDTAPR